MAKNLIVSLSPHVHGRDSVQRNMYGVCIALIPALLTSLYFFGLGAAIVLATSVAACVFFEWAITKYVLKRDRVTITDGSAILTGLLLGFNLPSNLPIWIILIGALVAIGIGKMTFGGLGCNPFNPALVGRVFLLVSFPVQMTTWPVPGQMAAYLDAETGATPLAVMKEAIKSGDASVLQRLPDAIDMLVGQTGGCLGEVSALALLIGLAYIVGPTHRDMAHSGLHSGYRFCTGRTTSSVQSRLCVSRNSVADGRYDAGCLLHGYGLRDLTHDSEGTDYLRSGHRSSHRSHSYFRRISRRHVLRNLDYERLYAVD